MKKLVAIATVFVVLCVAMGAGPEGQANIEAFEKLGFEMVVHKKLMPGAPQQMKITEKTIAKLEEMMKSGKGVSVADGGQVEIMVIEK